MSSDSRLDLAYRAIMQAALVAMLANGFRPSTSEPGHHQLLIQALPKTLGLAPQRIRLLDAFRAARNQSDYAGVPVSDTVALECAVEARHLIQEVRIGLAPIGLIFHELQKLWNYCNICATTALELIPGVATLWNQSRGHASSR